MIKSALQSSLTNDIKYRSMSAGAVPSSEYLIQTYEVGATPLASVTFENLGQYAGVYKHLQLVYLFRDSRANVWGEAVIRYNGDSGSSYREHNLRGAGGSVTSASYARTGVFVEGAGNSATSGAYAGGVLDLLDAFNTSKTTVARYLQGRVNGDDFVGLLSNLWNNTASLSTMSISSNNSTFLTGSRFSLYGVV